MPRNQVVVADNNNNASISGSFTAGSIIRSGGLATQFLMANGSVSTNPGWITGYTETDTLATVTARGASTNTYITQSGTADWYMYGFGARGASAGQYGIGLTADIANRTLSFHVPDIAAYSNSGNTPKFGWYSNNATELMTLQSATGNLWVRGTLSAGRITTTGLYGPSTSGNIPIWQYDANNPGYGIVYFESSPDLLRIDVSGQALSGTPDFLIGPDYAQVNGNTVWHAGNLTNLNQLTNGPGYITQSTGDGRYLLGTTNPSNPGNFTLSIGNNGSYSYVQSHSSQPLELNPVGNTVRIAGNVVWHQGNLTNLNQLTNGPGYVTGGPYLPTAGGTLTGVLTISTIEDGKLILRAPAGDTSQWNYINFVGTDGVRDAYLGTDGGGAPQWWRDDNNVNISLGSNVNIGGGGIVLTAADADVRTNRGRFQVYNNAGTGNLGYRIRTDDNGGWRWQFVDGGNTEYFGVAYSTGVVTFGASSGTIASRGGFSDFIGYNPSYGSYIGGGVANASNYLYAGGYFYDGSSVRTLWHTGNFNPGSYLPLSGGTMTGDLRFNQGSGFGRIAYADNYHGMILRGIPNNAAGDVTVGDYTSLIQHSGDFRFYRTNGSINELYFQVNASGVNWRGNAVLHASNYNSYSPTLTGGGASGTWSINITGSAGSASSASSVPWTGVSSGTRTNYNLRFQPFSGDYAGFEFNTSSGGGGGYFLIRGGSDNDVYTAEGITLVADAGWLTLAQRTQSNKGVRIMTGSSSTTRIEIVSSGMTTVNSGLTVLSGLAWNNATPALNVGGSGDARIQVRHIWGKEAGTANPDHLWLQYTNSTFGVQIGASGGSNPLYVAGNIYMGGYFGGNLVATQSWVTSQGYITGSYLPLSGGTMTGSISTPSGTAIYIGGQNVSTSGRLIINWHSDADYNYLIGKRAGAWTQPMDIAFYTGLRYHAHSAYNAHIFYIGGYDSNEAFSVGRGDSHTRVVYNLGVGNITPDLRLSVNGDAHVSGTIYMGGSAGNYNSWGSRTYTSSGNYYLNAASHTFDNVGYGSTWSVIYSGGNITLSSGTSGTTGKLIFKTTDNSDTNKYIMQDGYWTVIGTHSNEGMRVRDSAGNILINIAGSTNGYPSKVGIGNTTPAYKLHVSGDIYADGGWLRVSGTSGLYFESYGGGWHMTESSYMRAYNGKSVHMNYGSVDYVGSLYLESGGQGVHLQPNTGSYGSLQVTSSRGGWHGIRFTGSNVNLMVNTTEVGFHNNASGWQMRWESGTGYVHKGSTGGGTSATILDSSNFGSWAAPRAYVTDSFVEFLIYGDPNTYYPVTIHNWNGSFSWQRYSIHRSYYDTAPWDPIGTGSHKGGLTFSFEWAGDIAWGGNDKSIRVLEFDETYTTTVAGMQLAHCEGVVVWLRGGGAGGAYYRLHGPGGRAQGYSINMSTWTSCAGVSYSPRSYDGGTVNSEIRSRYPIRGSGSGDIYVNNQAVIHSGNIGSQSVSYASSAGNADTVDGYHASNFLGYFGNSYYQANTWIQLNGVYGLYAPGTNGAHWLPNTNSSYTTWRIAGSRNGYSGIHDDHSSVQMVMFDGSGNGGTYREANGRWYWYYHLSNDCMGIGTSSTNSSYSIYSNKGHGVYYSGNNAAGFDAIHSGSINGGSTVQGLTLQWQGYGATYVIAYKQGELSPSDMAHVYSVGGFYFKIYDGSTNRFHRWDDNGSVSINSSSQGSYIFNVTGDIYATADVIAFSDARVKEDVRTVENALDKVTKLRGVTYIKKDEENKKRKMGVIAQEVLEVLPEVVHEDNDGYYGVSYGNIVGVLIEAIKEQQKQIDELKQELKK